MSFSANVKSEIISQICEPCCNFAQNYALLLFGRAFSSSELSYLTENQEAISAYKKAVEFFSGKNVDYNISDAGNYSISIKDFDTVNAVIKAMGFEKSSVKRRVNFAVFENECCFAAFVRGAFIACGTVTDPEKEYHLEFSVPTKGLCDDLMKIFEELAPSPKMTMRSGAYIVYLKNSTDIEDTLALMGAAENSLELMGTKMYKDVRNTINRKVNFENANLKRSIAASNKQYEAIITIKEAKGLESLSDDLRVLAELRIANRELSNAELAKLMPESISVSGINHRFQRIIKLSEEIKQRGI